MPEHDNKKDALEDLERDLKAVQERDTPESLLRTNVDAPVSPISPTHPGNVSHHDARDEGRPSDAPQTASSSAHPESPGPNRDEPGHASKEDSKKSTDRGTATRWIIGAFVATLAVWLLLSMFT